jgi:hypothetical protein
VFNENLHRTDGGVEPLMEGVAFKVVYTLRF